MRSITLLFCAVLAQSQPAGAGSRVAPPRSQAPAAEAKQQFLFDKIKLRPVARVGTREITVGDVIEGAAAFHPRIADEIRSGYGDWFLSSDTFDQWIDCYVDLFVLARDERVKTVMPESAAIESIIADMAMRNLASVHNKSAGPPASLPAHEVAVAMDQIRRSQGFEAARQARLDQLVPIVTELQTLRQELLKKPSLLMDQVRARHLNITVRDVGQRRFPRERRERIREDAQRVLARLRSGDNFSEVSAQLTGSPDTRAKETLPWISQTTPLPVPVLRALFAAKAGEFVGPIETRDGFYIGKVEETGKAHAEEFEHWVPLLQQILRRESQFDLMLKLRGSVDILFY
ncbi:MAG: peptidyl-prolyl cis-trans isomerase [Planctomycetes bacterium]|nr:peptidyl-prolyl cis-trans isomerase [Planctomycetota bacterium]